MGSITDRRLPAGVAVPGLDAEAFVAAVIEAGKDLDAAARAVESALAPLLPETHGPYGALADQAVGLLEADPGLNRAADLAARLGVSVRSLHRVFREYVGVGPGWARLAADLGYCDQAHLVRDFTRTVGEPPARYAAATRP